MPSILDSSSKHSNGFINGNFDFWQRRTSVNGSGLSTSGYLSADRIRTEWNWASGAPNLNILRSTNVPTVAQSGFQSRYSWELNSQTSKTFPASLDYFQPFIYRMEGHDYQRLHGKTATFSFWVFASVIGKYSFALANAGFTRTYLTTFEVTSANTWTQIRITVPMESSIGVYTFDNTTGLHVYVAQLSTTALSVAPTSSWLASGGLTANDAVNYLATVGAVLRIAQFQILEGAILNPVFNRAATTVTAELLLCQRYYCKSYLHDNPAGAFPDFASVLSWQPQNTALAYHIHTQYYPVEMRTGPNLTFINPNNGQNDNTTPYQNVIWDGNAATSRNFSVYTQSAKGFSGHHTPGSEPNNTMYMHYTADAEL